MSTEATSDLRFQMGHVLFMDIVGYSKLLVNDQARLIRRLSELVQGTEQFRATGKKNRLVRVPTGDGMALVFRDSPESPVWCALQLGHALQKETPPLPLRMGIHSGLVNILIDVNNRTNVAGPGINIAQRVMDCGDAGHILLSKHLAEDLGHDARWRPLLHELGPCEVKHGLRIELVNLYNSEVGDPRLPDKIRLSWKKRAASSVLVFSTTAALALVIVGSSWFVSTQFQKPDAAIPKRVETTTAAPLDTPMPATTSIPDPTLANAKSASAIWPQSLDTALTSGPRKLFAGTWRGTVRSVGPQSSWDSQLDLTIDETETHWGNMPGGSVSRQGRTLIYRRSYRLGRSTSVQVEATLVADDDDRTATYTISQKSVTGRSQSTTVGKGILERVSLADWRH
jgi:hypothetical protein